MTFTNLPLTPTAFTNIAPIGSMRSTAQNIDKIKVDYPENSQVLTIEDHSIDPEINALKFELETNRKRLFDALSLVQTNATTAFEIAQAKENVEQILKKLAQAYQKKEAGSVIARHSMTLYSSSKMLVANGSPVSAGKTALYYAYDLNRVTAVFNIKNNINISQLVNYRVNGVPVEGVERPRLDQGSLVGTTQVTVVLDLKNPLAKTGERVQLDVDVVKPVDDFPSLNQIGGDRVTMGPVTRVKYIPVISLDSGPGRYLLPSGSEVKENQVVAQIDNKFYGEELAHNKELVKTIEFQISQIVDSKTGVPLKRDLWDQLNNKKAALLAEQSILQFFVDHLKITASQAGILYYSNVPKTFTAGEEIAEVRGQAVDVGGNTEETYALTPADWTAAEVKSDVAVAIDSNGMRYPAEVFPINLNPVSEAREFPDQKAWQAVVYDLHGGVGDHDVMTLIFPTNDVQRGIISTALAKAQNQETAPPPIAKLDLQVSSEDLNALDKALSQGLTNTIRSASPFDFLRVTNSATALTLDQIGNEVRNNPLITIFEDLSITNSLLAEGQAYDLNVRINGGPVWQGNELKWRVGIIGTFANAIRGGLATGNAYAAGAPVITDFFGDLMAILDGKAKAQTQVDKKKTVEARHQRDIVSNNAVQMAKMLALQIWSGNQRLTVLKLWQDKLTLELGKIEARTKLGMSSSEDVEQIRYRLQNVTAQLTDLEGQMKDSTVALNFLRGNKIEDLDHPIAVLFGANNFDPISDTTLNQWIVKLTTTNSPNPVGQLASANYERTLGEAHLVGLDYRPTATAAGAHLSGTNKPSNSLVPATSEEGLLRTSALEVGLDLDGGFGFDLWNPAKRRKNKMYLQRIIAARRAQQKEIAHEVAETRKIKERINSLSKQIKIKMQALGDNRAFLDQMDRNGYYYFTQKFPGNEREKDNILSLLNDQVQYALAVLELEKLGLHTDPAQLSAVSTLKNAFQKILYVLFFTFELTSYPQEILSNRNSGAAYTAKYPQARVASTWIERSQDPLKAAEDILIKIPNINLRNETLEGLFDQYRKVPAENVNLKNAFTESLRRVVLRTNFPEVRLAIYNFIKMERNDHGLRFFIQTYLEGKAASKNYLVNESKSFLKEINLLHQEYWANLTSQDFNPDPTGDTPLVNSQTANEVLFTIISEEPQDSLFTSQTLRGNLYTIEDLNKIYQIYEAFTQKPDLTPSDRTKIVRVLETIKVVMVVRTALSHVVQSYNLAGYTHQGGGFFASQDSIGEKVYAQNLPKGATNYLRSAESLTLAGLENGLYPRLYKESTNLVETQLTVPIVGGSLLFPPDSPIFLKNQNEIDAPDVLLAQYVNLKPKGRIAFINNLNASDINLMISILQFSSTGKQAEPLDRVVKLLCDKPQGRLALARLYPQATKYLQGIIESYDWLPTIWNDLQDAKENPSKGVIWRQFLRTMWINNHQDWPMYAFYATVADPGLHLVFYNEGNWETIRKAEIQRRAFLIEEQVRDEYTDRRNEPLVAQSEKKEIEESQSGDTLQQAARNPDPRVFVEKYGSFVFRAKILDLKARSAGESLIKSSGHFCSHRPFALNV